VSGPLPRVWRWIASGIALVLGAGTVVVGATREPAAVAPVAAPAVASVTILGRRDLRAAGDTATWCAVALLQDGTLRLGRRVLLVRAQSPSTVRAAEVAEDAPARCVALLRAARLPTSLPLIDNAWDTRPAPSPVPAPLRRALLAPPARA